MRQTENNLFPEMSKIGVGAESGDLSFPDMRKIANAYNIPYCCIKNNTELSDGLDYALNKMVLDLRTFCRYRTEV